MRVALFHGDFCGDDCRKIVTSGSMDYNQWMIYLNALFLPFWLPRTQFSARHIAHRLTWGARFVQRTASGFYADVRISLAQAA